MTCSRENITEERLVELKKLLTSVVSLAPADRAKIISAKLAEELNVSEEGIDNALSELNDRKDYESDEQYAFVKQWGKISADFSKDWFQFVGQFIVDMQDGAGSHRRAVHNIDKIINTASGLDSNFWNAENTTNVFIHYLASLPMTCYANSDINFDHQREIIKEAIINRYDFCDADAFNRRAQVLLEIRAHDPITEPALLEEVRKIYLYWSQLHAQAKADGVREDEYNARVCAHWQQSFAQPFSEQSPETKKIFDTYCETLSSLDEARKSALLPPPPPVSYKSNRNSLTYAFGGGAAGVVIAAAVITGVALAAGAVLTIGSILGLFALIATACILGVTASYQLKKYLDKQDQTQTRSDTVTDTSSQSSFKQICTSALCVVVMGFSGCCYAGVDDDVDQPDPNPPTQIDDDYNDDTAEPKPSSGASVMGSGR